MWVVIQAARVNDKNELHAIGALLSDIDKHEKHIITTLAQPSLEEAAKQCQIHSSSYCNYILKFSTVPKFTTKNIPGHDLIRQCLASKSICDVCTLYAELRQTITRKIKMAVNLENKFEQKLEDWGKVDFLTDLKTNKYTIYTIHEEHVDDPATTHLDTGKTVDFKAALQEVERINANPPSEQISRDLHSTAQELLKCTTSTNMMLVAIISAITHLQNSECDEIARSLTSTVPVKADSRNIYLVFGCPAGDPTSKTWNCPENQERLCRLREYLEQNKSVLADYQKLVEYGLFTEPP